MRYFVSGKFYSWTANFLSYFDIPNMSSGEEALWDIELEPFDIRLPAVLLELLESGGSQFLAVEVSSDHDLPSAKVEI